MWAFTWIEHTVLISRGKVLSYDPWFFWPWVFSLYNEKDWQQEVRQICSTIELPDIDLEQYEWKKCTWVYCYEALAPILLENNINIMETLNNRTNNIITTIIIVISSIAMWYFFHDFIESFIYDVQYIDNIEELCQFEQR